MWQLPRLNPEDILIYLRKSRTDDPSLTVDEVLAKHEQMLDDWVAEHLSPTQKVPEHNRYREVVSGETIDSRPKVQEVLRRMESPRVKAILIVEPQRLSRGDLEDIGRLVKLLRYTNTLVITLRYSYDLKDDRDRDDFERELKKGNEFLEYQKRIMNNGRLLSVQNGNFIGQRPPYGYKKTVIKEGKRKCHTLEPDPEKAAIVKMIFEMYVADANAHEIARTLNSMGIPSALGEQWTAASIKPILSNDHYIGMVHWNRRKTQIVVEEGEVIATRPRASDFLVFPGKHPPIIDQDLWDAVQAIRGSRPPVKDKSKFANPLAGIVYCRCGGRLNRQQYLKNGIERCSPRLHCVNQTQCQTSSCSVDEMMELVIEALESAIADFTLKIEEAPADAEALQEKKIAQLEKRLQELDRLEISQWEKYTMEAMPKHIFEKLNEKVLKDRQAVQEVLQQVQEDVPPSIDYLHKLETFARTVETLKDPDASIKEKNKLLKQCIEKITYYRKRKETDNRRYGLPEPIELTFQFKI